MRILAIAMGGCLKGEPSYGITEDTGGHITYVLGAMRALAMHPQVTDAEIVTRLFDAPELGEMHALKHESLGRKLCITRIDSGNRDYLSKGRLTRDIPAFTKALIANLQSRAQLPDIIHAHFADAAKVAKAVRDELGIPFIYTAHSLAIDKAQAMDVQQLGLAARIADEDAAIASANAIIGSSRDECERQLLSYRSADQTRIHRLKPGIGQEQATSADMAGAAELIAPFLRHPGRPIVLAVARPVAKKNLVGLVKAFAADPELRRSANLVILAGLRSSIENGEEEQVDVLRQLIDTIDANDLHGCVAYPRRHTTVQVRGMYALATKTGGVFVNPAMIEPFGLTILEAAVHGLPVVATKHGGPADIIEEIQHGILVEPRNLADIAKAIAGLIGDRSRWEAASSNARRNIRSVQWKHYASGFVSVAREARERKPTRSIGAIRDKLVLCDIDNTLTGCRIAARNFAKFISGRGDVVFGIATGRSLIEARRLVQEWNLPIPDVWITSVGSEIYWDTPSGLMADQQYEALIATNWHPRAIGGALSKVAAIEPQNKVDQRQYKSSYFTVGEGAEACVRNALTARGLDAKVIQSHERLLDVLPRNAGKGAAMRHVAAKLGIAQAQVFVAGDSGNDLDMLETAANAIVVSNHEPVLARLRGRPSVYFARSPYAAGALEGMVAMMDRSTVATLRQTRCGVAA